jgi:hypothetical protein
LIDFEHVRKGIPLCDQTRLAVNLLCDIYSNSLSRTPFHNQKSIANLVENVISAIGHLGTISDILWTNTAEVVSFRSILQPLKHRGGLVVTDVMREILLCSDERSQSADLEAQLRWRQFLGYTLYAAALKEYQYSCNSLRAETVGNGASYVYDNGLLATLLAIVGDTKGVRGAHSRLRAMLDVIGSRTLLLNTNPDKLPTIRAGELARHLISLCVLLTVTPEVGLYKEPIGKTEPIAK